MAETEAAEPAAPSKPMKHILVTGANKGIGRALVERLLLERDDTVVYACSRDVWNGEKLKRALLEVPGQRLERRLHIIQLDVTNREVRKLAEGEMLYAVVNNAGVHDGAAANVLDVNLRGVYAVCDAFASLTAPGHSRVLNVSSGSATLFVAKCSSARRAFFANPTVSQSELDQLCARFTAAVDLADMRRGSGDGGASLQALGFPTPSEAKAGGGLAYGFSKAALNCYTAICAAGRGPFPEGVICNALSPGFIATDLTRAMAGAMGREPEDMGALPVREGTVALIKLLFDGSGASGRYYGSDGLRSPLDRYRSPGAPEWNGVD